MVFLTKAVLPLAFLILPCFSEDNGYTQPQLYAGVFDIDIEALINNEKAMYGYVDCVLDILPCGEMEGRLKEILPEIFRQACTRCTQLQKHNLRRFLENLEIYWPYDYFQLMQKYDPDRKYINILMRYLKNA